MWIVLPLHAVVALKARTARMNYVCSGQASSLQAAFDR